MENSPIITNEAANLAFKMWLERMFPEGNRPGYDRDVLFSCFLAGCDAALIYADLLPKK